MNENTIGIIDLLPLLRTELGGDVLVEERGLIFELIPPTHPLVVEINRRQGSRMSWELEKY